MVYTGTERNLVARFLGWNISERVETSFGLGLGHVDWKVSIVVLERILKDNVSVNIEYNYS